MLGSTLKAALREDPLPPLEQVAGQLSYASDVRGRAWEPRLCARLTAPRRRFAERSTKALRNRLIAILKENRPPSLQDVHERLGIAQAIPSAILLRFTALSLLDTSSVGISRRSSYDLRH